MGRTDLMSKVAAGEYVVDPHAVAGAMLSRASVRALLLGSEPVLEPGDLDGLAAGPDDRDSGSRPHPA